MNRIAILFSALLPALAYALPIASEAPWVSFDAAQSPPVRIETKIPAQAALTDGPQGHRAVSVTVPDMSRDEKACSFNMDLPKLGGGYNAVRLWLKGTDKTKAVEVVFRGPGGSFGAQVPLEPTWREVLLSPQNTHPYFETKSGHLDPSDLNSVRFCFGEWLGETGGPHTVSIGPISAVQSPALAPVGKVTLVEKPQVPLPLQPFTVELLDLERGKWHFTDALGQRLDLEGPVTAFAFPGKTDAAPTLAYLCCDPEFPEDLTHATLKVVSPTTTAGNATWFRIEESYFSAAAEVSPGESGAFVVRLHGISLGPAVTGDRYVAGMYLRFGEKSFPLWIAPDDGGAGLSPRLLTDRVGNVFSEGETVRLSLATSRAAPAQTFSLTAKDYATGRNVWHGEMSLPSTPGGLSVRPFDIPLQRFGVFEVSAQAAGLPPATVRVCRIPRPVTVNPDASPIGINLFQQQIWWYAYQAPMMAKAGVHWIRPWLAWENTWNTQQPEPDKWDTRALDSALRRMDQFKERYQLIFFAPPQWATGQTGWSAPPVEKMDLWAAYVEKLVGQYKGRIRYWEIWNEPDGMWPEETRHSGAHYLALLKSAWAAAKRADPDCVVLGLSHAGYEDWLENVGKLGAKDYMDAATIHCYAAPKDFIDQVERRRDFLRRYGMGDKMLWINELGNSAYDFSPGYSAKYGCSERNQATTVPELYALALSVDPRMKPYWFCTYDPRDAAHESDWTGDCGCGVIYLGFLPKLAYASLAGTARQLDGRQCLGRADVTADMHQVSFTGPMTVAWHDQPEKSGLVRATDLGCAPDEQIIVRDIYTNQVAAGKASGIGLDFSQGALYIEGSRQLAAIAQAEMAGSIDRREVMLNRGESAAVTLPAPKEATTRVQVQPGVQVLAAVMPQTVDGKREVRLSAPRDCERTSGLVKIVTRFPKGTFGLLADHEVTRSVAVTVGEPNLIPDGGFFLGNLDEWMPQRTSPFTWDAQVGHAAPGSLRLDAPLDRRLVYWNVRPVKGRPMKLRCWVKTENLIGGIATLNACFFGTDKWLGTVCLATNGPTGEIEKGWNTIEQPGRMPSGTTDWTPVEATLRADQIPADTDHIAFFIDVSKGGTGRLWIDDIDLWQPEGG